MRRVLRSHPGEILSFAPVTYESPAGLFKVTFTPNFGIRMGESGVAVHVWNTTQPRLLRERVYAALSLFPRLYVGSGNMPDDLAVLSLREQQVYRLSAAGRHADLGAGLVARVENLLRDVSEELGLPDTGEHPRQPPRQP